MRRNSGRDETYLIEAEVLQRLLRKAKVPVVNGVESTAENADSPQTDIQSKSRRTSASTPLRKRVKRAACAPSITR